MDRMRSDFSNPDSRFRGKPFWAWNGKLCADELRRQIRVMKQMGMGGFFMHSRVGLATEYLGDEWFAMVNACNDEARKQKMESWLYDEDRWPSGAAGGLVTRNRKYRQRMLELVMHKPGDFRNTRNVIAAFICRPKGCGITAVRPLKGSAKKAAEKGEWIASFRVAVADPSPWYNGYTYLDTMSAEAVKRFIEVTHKAYEREIKADLGKVVPGIFTDEPNYGEWWGQIASFDDLVNKGARVPWTDELPQAFKKRHGYDLVEHLPELFFNIDGRPVSRPRRDYFDVATHLFVTSFAGLIYQWCEENDVASTGHVLLEGSLADQTRVIGAAQRFYEYMQAPGIDILTDREPEYLTAKQCTSVANQFNRKWVLSELYGCTGWDFTFEGHKAVGDWQAVAGVTLRCHHLSWYTMSGQAKRDYPASISYQSPWWRDYAVVEDYYARLTAALVRGKPVRDVLVVHPIESAWALRHCMAPIDDDATRFDDELDKLQLNLLREHIDFDYGDEDMMARHSKVRKTKDGPVLSLAKAKYRAVVVPPSVTMRETTLRLLEKFDQAGGRVVFVGEQPGHIDAKPNDAATELAKRTCKARNTRSAMRKSLADVARCVSLADERGGEVKSLLYQMRQEKGRTILFICSRDRKKNSGAVRVTVPAEGDVQEWDLNTGETFAVSAEEADGTISFTTELPPTGSKLFVIDSELEDAPVRKEYTEKSRRKLTGKWDIYRDEPNVFVLDMPEPDYGDGFEDSEEILRIDHAVRDRMGLPRRGGRMVQPWARKKRRRKKSHPLGLRYVFQIQDAPVGPVQLAIETPDRFDISINGRAVSRESRGWWVDPCIKTVALPSALLKPGKNTLELNIDYTEEDNLEACFLLGEFGVRVSGENAKIVKTPERLKPGNWAKQGLPFYSSSVTYVKKVRTKPGKGEKVFLVLPRHSASHVKVRVDGEPVGSMPWAPYEVDLTEFLTGDNRLEIEVLSSRRNAFGPLHRLEPGAAWVGPNSFVTTGNAWTRKYQLVSYGLLTEPVLSVRKKV